MPMRLTNSGLKRKLSGRSRSFVIIARASRCFATGVGSYRGRPVPARSRSSFTPPTYLAARGATAASWRKPLEKLRVNRS